MVRNKKAFTIVEILVAIVVIAILAAIVVVTYRSITTQAGDAHYAFSDGNSPGWIWNGVANNSTSVGSPKQ